MLEEEVETRQLTVTTEQVGVVVVVTTQGVLEGVLEQAVAAHHLQEMEALRQLW
jgi:hypothetical protein